MPAYNKDDATLGGGRKLRVLGLAVRVVMIRIRGGGGGIPYISYKGSGFR